jgi:hypothetical protein
MLKLTMVLLLLVVTLTPGTAAAASNELAGTWTLTLADERRPDGTRAEPYGADAEGLLIVDRDGRYSLQIFRRDRPKFASGNKRTGTAHEYESAVLGMSSHIGRCSVDRKSGTITFRIERASYPNWEGTQQVRRYQLSGDELSYEVPASATGDGTIPRSVWHRVR